MPFLSSDLPIFLYLAGIGLGICLLGLTCVAFRNVFRTGVAKQMALVSNELGIYDSIYRETAQYEAELQQLKSFKTTHTSFCNAIDQFLTFEIQLAFMPGRVNLLTEINQSLKLLPSNEASSIVTTAPNTIQEAVNTLTTQIKTELCEAHKGSSSWFSKAAC